MARYDIHVPSICQRKKPLKVKYIHFLGAFFVINAESVEILRLSKVYWITKVGFKPQVIAVLVCAPNSSITASRGVFSGEYHIILAPPA